MIAMLGIVIGSLASLVTLGATPIAAQVPSAPVAEVDGLAITDDDVTRVIGMRPATTE